MVELAFFKPHEQWKLTKPLFYNITQRSVAFKNVNGYYDVILTIHLERNPKFYSFLFVVPTVLLHLLSPFVFLLPVESGEKTSMSITLLLAQVVSMASIAEVLPASSLHFPVISYLLCASIVQMGLDLILSAISEYFRPLNPTNTN